MFQKEQKLRNQELMRYINNQNRTLDEIFEEVISKKTHLLDKYPQLRIRYILDNNFVRKKQKKNYWQPIVNIIINQKCWNILKNCLKNLKMVASKNSKGGKYELRK